MKNSSSRVDLVGQDVTPRSKLRGQVRQREGIDAQRESPEGSVSLYINMEDKYFESHGSSQLVFACTDCVLATQKPRNVQPAGPETATINPRTVNRPSQPDFYLHCSINTRLWIIKGGPVRVRWGSI